MQPVIERPSIPAPFGGSLNGIAAWARTLGTALVNWFGQVGFRLNRVLPKDGTEAMTAPLPLKTYTTATLPAAASYSGCVVFVSDAAAGSKFQGSDGATWVSLG